MNSESLPTASSPKAADNTEVLSQRIPGQGEAQEAILVVPEGKTPVAEHMGGQTPMDTDDGDRIQFDPQPNTTPEAHVASASRMVPLSKEGGCANSADNLYQSRGAGHSGGSASECFHCGGALYPYGYGG